MLLKHHLISASSVLNRTLYNEQKYNHPLARNMPPVAGRIGWVRHLYQKIEEPMSYIKEHTDVLYSPDGQAVVKMYNQAAVVFVEFETVYHRAWMAEVPKLDYFFVNFDPKITEVIREAKCLMKMDLEVPKQALHLVKMESKLNANHPLSGEKVRWLEQSREFKSQINRLVGDVLQLAGFLSYCGPFNQSYHDMLKGIWEAELRSHKIPFTEKPQPYICPSRPSHYK
ncbi:dynein heavy chain 8, axonemal-like isoform X2 [Mastacembelus armatus]|nr:dynein heavy chain 8, axonemal-like isoform X2 [Mastacembelus armatus]